MRRILYALSVLTILIAGAANARTSQPSELRGFETCKEAANEQYANGLVTSRMYYLNKHESTNTYFVNASAWQDGERTQLRITCDTSRNGRQLLAYDAAPGRYVPQSGTVTIDVAAN